MEASDGGVYKRGPFRGGAAGVLVHDGRVDIGVLRVERGDHEEDEVLLVVLPWIVRVFVGGERVATL